MTYQTARTTDLPRPFRTIPWQRSVLRAHPTCLPAYLHLVKIQCTRAFGASTHPRLWRERRLLLGLHGVNTIPPFTWWVLGHGFTTVYVFFRRVVVRVHFQAMLEVLNRLGPVLR